MRKRNLPPQEPESNPIAEGNLMSSLQAAAGNPRVPNPRVPNQQPQPPKAKFAPLPKRRGR